MRERLNKVCGRETACSAFLNFILSRIMMHLCISCVCLYYYIHDITYYIVSLRFSSLPSMYILGTGLALEFI
ncbi:hypothetical protein TSAR_003746 [Trichomalopsis sarcophagae]|uniref:Uncharacterized protein n=1 Tax=Trichomalopsis sarcophagae TaxID=543379 RepID=A0A232FAI9_9HYME|nr:hypothetical protein TSAR_003746 [Trichomalopsis sarcophagae]